MAMTSSSSSIVPISSEQIKPPKPLSMVLTRSSSSISKGSPQEKHEVFISFRGMDTRKSFTSHLYAALTRLDIKTYIDKDLERGNEISSSLLQAIEDAKLSIVVFSENYADSRWCLDELAKIAECRRNGQIIVPIFYGIDPSSVRDQRGRYVKAFAKLEQRYSDDKEKTQSWRHALTEAANHSGWDYSNHSLHRTECELVEQIAKDVLEKLNRVYVGDLDYKITRLEQLGELQQEYSQQIESPENTRNHEATLQRIIQLKMEKKFRMLRLSPDLLSHMEISPITKNYF